jgi:hypothetical protein
MLALLATIEACESLAGRSAPNAPAVTTVSRPLDAPDKLRHAAGVL